MAEARADESADALEVPAATAAEFLLAFARAGHQAGYPTSELEDRVLALAEAVGLEGVQVSATPTLVDVSVGPIPRQRTYTVRVRPPAVDLDAIARLDDLVQATLDGKLGAEAALAEVTEIQANPLARPWLLLIAGYAIAGAALAPVLGGGRREVEAAALVGIVVGAIALPARRTARTEAIVAPLAAVAASFTAAWLTELGLDARPNLVTLAALVTFLPGMTLTIGMRELATEHLQSGVANTASALVQLLGLVFGVAIGQSIATSWFGAVNTVPPHSSFSEVHVLAAIAAGLGFTLTLRARYPDAAIMCTAAVLALVGNEVGKTIFGKEAAVFVAAIVVGVAGGLAGVMLRRSPLVFIVPGVLMLVPGSAGFNSALQLLSEQTVHGINTAFDTFVTAISIAYGLMVSTVVLPRRFTHVTSRRQ